MRVEKPQHVLGTLKMGVQIMVPAVTVRLSVTLGQLHLAHTPEYLYGNKPRAEGVETSVTLVQFFLRTKLYDQQKVHSFRVTCCLGAPCQSDLLARRQGPVSDSIRMSCYLQRIFTCSFQPWSDTSHTSKGVMAPQAQVLSREVTPLARVFYTPSAPLSE